ncbi:uncharacterized protein LOC129578250 [Sitodiplosis mosellana]|uniref:uncharacterized protein LOC129578250 n=1 Tax=Sitodiplosis mosellana TaxID=263140 RepID=UPI0024447427|nr:uncharacterized protein LOC129578250 [Sitodiplosis mosellana]
MLWKKESKNILWDKESNQQNALFVDLFANVKFDIPAPRGVLPQKSDQISQRLREKGNDYFVRKDYFAAMKLYNQALCFAENGSEQLSYAYSNRSSCFFRLKLYSKCLVDIELALQSNCAQQLIPKLNDRKAKCLEVLDEELSYFAPKLSHEPDERFPCMVKVLEMQQNVEFGREIVATADIPAGKTIMVEDGFAAGLYGEAGVNCDICYSSYTNLIPCYTCTRSMFCFGKCDKNDFHFVECGLRWKPQGPFDYRYSVVRSIVFALKTFTNVDDLMEFAASAIMSDQFELPDSMLDDKAKYNVFFRNFKSNFPGWSEGHQHGIQSVYEGLISHEFISQKFPTKRKERFLQHLISHHIQARRRMMTINCTMQKGFTPLIGLYFNLSCTPNATLLFSDSGSYVLTIRPIKSGEQLFVHYMDEDFMVKNIGYKERRAKIQRDLNYVCMCERCIAESSNQKAPELFDDSTRYVVLEKIRMGMNQPAYLLIYRKSRPIFKHFK